MIAVRSARAAVGHMAFIADISILAETRTGGEKKDAEITTNAEPPGVVFAAERKADQNDKHKVERYADGEVAHLLKVVQRCAGHEVELDDRVQHRIRRVQFVGQQEEKDEERNHNQRVGDGSVQTGLPGLHLDNGKENG